MEKRIELKFECQEDFDAMPCTSKGRFCGACNREIIDFTHLSLSEIYRAKEENPDLCGIFLTEHLEPHLQPIELPHVRKWAFLSTLLVSLNVGNVSGQIQKDANFEEISFVEPSDEFGATTAKTASEMEPTTAEELEQTPFINRKRFDRKRNRYHRRYVRRKARRWYWSYRFPFIHKKPVITHRMGVPRWL